MSSKHSLPRARVSRLAAALAVTAALVTGAVAAQPAQSAPAAAATVAPPTGGTTIVDENFQGAALQDPSAWSLLSAACLSGAAAGASLNCASAQNYGAAGTKPVLLPTLGQTPGYLQLTDAPNTPSGSGTRGAVLYTKPITATSGLSITFDQYQYGNTTSTPADGIGFFLNDGSVPLTAPGGYGGSLGYAPRVATANEPGLAGGYLGVGLDVYGNYYDDGEGRGVGCPSDEKSPITASGQALQNAIDVRGPGSGMNGYCLLAATVNPSSITKSSAKTTLTGTLQGTVTSAANIENACREINIQVSPVTPTNPVPQITVLVKYSCTDPSAQWTQALSVAGPANPPSTFHFGLAASTGGSNDVHLIRNLTVQTINALQGDLVIQKQLDASTPLPATITAGTRIPYLYTVTNNSSQVLNALSIADDKIPTADISCDATTLQPLPGSQASTTCHGDYTVTAADVAAGSVTNIATANGTAANGTQLTSPQATLTVPLSAALSIAKQVTTAGPYTLGENVSYRYTVTNTGVTTISSIAVKDDRIPSGITCGLNQLAAGQSTTCVGTDTLASDELAADGTITNTAYATGTSQFGQSVTSPTTSATISVAADLSITKTVSDSSPAVGDTVSYTVTAHNNGPSDATGVVATDKLPAGLGFVSATPSVGSYNPATGAWTIGTLANGAGASLTITATVTASGAITNSASIGYAAGATGAPDPDATNNQASVSINGAEPSLSITKTTGGGASADAVLGSHATFVVTVTNSGSAAATAVAVGDRLPAGLGYVSSTGDGAYDSSTGVWTVGSIAAGASATRTFVVSADAVGDAANTATIRAAADGAGQTDVAGVGASASATLDVAGPDADLVIDKTVDPSNATVGDTVRYTITVNDLGPDTAYNVTVDDLQPSGLTVDPTSVALSTDDPTPGASTGSVNADLTTWTLPELHAAPAGSLWTTTLTYSGVVTAAGALTNTATISTPELSDHNTANNTASATVDVTAADPAGSDPAGSDPAGSDPAGSDPASDPAGSDPADPAGGTPAAAADPADPPAAAHLAITGTDVLPALGIAAAALLAGLIVIVIAAARRRPRRD